MKREDILKMEAGRELDALVAEKVMGWHIVTDESGRTHWEDDAGHWGAGMNQNPDFFEDEEDFHTLHWHPSESILWAWEVVLKLNEMGMNVMVTELIPYRGFEENLSRCEVERLSDGDEKAIQAIADTAPLAICRAALLAVMEEE